MPFVRRPTCSIHYEDLGPRGADAVVLLPSLLCDRAMWSHMEASLARDHRVLSVDMRGHGRSTPPTERYTQEDQCDDVIAVLDDASVQSAVLVGLSQGGFAAMRAALYHPRRVRAIALLNSSAAQEAVAGRVKYMAMAASVRAIGLTSLVAKRVVPLMFSERFMRESPAVVEQNVARWAAMDGRAIFYAVDAVANRTDFVKHLSELTLPVLALAGTDDRALPPSRALQIREHVKHARYVEIDGAGHLSTIEKPEETTAAVREFLTSLDASNA